ncbi:DUF3099 domain-containing protein [Microbacterium oxydans]|uniref:DUF3099 domain-containing protein n=1 Tax=Microbacterium TaxID=33882 RepID=UPI00187D5033|nr:DUF3099 domain-containing protein [Microbacterium sp. R1]MBE7954730.1 DUF3099 domain-containing protein [Microbacterium sp. R1]
MKNARQIPAVTSLPQSPQDEGDHRVRRYVLTMFIRIACFALMVLVQPYGWYTWVFGISAAVLPYIAVVFANAGSDSTEMTAESPRQELEAPGPAPIANETTGPQVFTIHEGPKDR